MLALLFLNAPQVHIGRQVLHERCKAHSISPGVSPLLPFLQAADHWRTEALQNIRTWIGPVPGTHLCNRSGTLLTSSPSALLSP